MSQWPVVRLIVEGSVSRAEIPAFLVELDRLYARRERFVHLIEIHRFRMEPDLALPLGEWMKRNKELIQTWNAGVAIVSASPFFRFFMSALFLVQPIPTVHTTVQSVEEAEAWLRERAEASGLASSYLTASVRSSGTG